MPMSADRVDTVQQWGVRNAGVWIPLAVAAVVLAFVAVAGWLAFRWFEDGMSGVYVTEDAGEAVRIAGVMGVRLDISDVEYGEVTSQFQGWPMAFLIVKADNASARDTIIRDSRTRCHAGSPEDFAKLRAPTRHGPLPSASLRTCTRATDSLNPPPTGERAGNLSMWFDPESRDRGAWLYMSVVPY